MKNGKYQQADNNYFKRAKFRTKPTKQSTQNVRGNSKFKNR